MRITTGQFAGRTIQLPKGPEIRPTLDHVRQAMFNLIGGRVQGARVLDLFSGTGALGIEALSRGAAHVTFVDRSLFCVRAIEENLKNLGLGSGTSSVFTLVRSEVLTAIRHLGRDEESFDLILLDPPYGRELARKSLIASLQCAIVSQTGLVVIEHEKRDELPARLLCGGPARLACGGPPNEEKEGWWQMCRSERYGDTKLTFYIKQ